MTDDGPQRVHANPSWRRTRHFRSAAALLWVLCVGGCARPTPDPIAAINRPAFELDQFTERAISGPLEAGLDAVTPGLVRAGLANLLHTAAMPRAMINDALQARPLEASQDLLRFALNATVGIAGLFDVATSAGIPANENDFGRTLCVWGIPFGPYVYFPLLGPSSAQEAVSATLDLIVAPGDFLFGFFAERSPRRRQLQAIREAYGSGVRPDLDFYTYQRLAYQQDRVREARGEPVFVPELGEPIAGAGRRSCEPPWVGADD